MKKILSLVISFYFLLSQTSFLFALENSTIDNVNISSGSVYINTSGNINYSKLNLSNPPKMIIDFKNSKLKTIQNIPGDSKFIKRVRTGQFSPEIARIVVELNQDADSEILKNGNVLVVNFKAKKDNNKEVKDSLNSEDITIIVPEDIPSSYKELKTEVSVSNNKSTKITKTKEYRDIMNSLPKSLISFDYQDADIKEVISMLSARANLNIIYSNDVSGNISISLKDVPFDEAFKTVLSIKGLAAQQVGDNILRIATPKTFMNEQKNSMLQTRVFFLNYTKATDIKSQIESIAQAEGRTTSKCNIDETNNALIITDTPLGLEASARLIKTIDRTPKQVLIEAKLVEVALDSDFHLGIQWSVSGNKNGYYTGANNINNAIGSSSQFGPSANQKSITPGYDPANITGVQANLSGASGGTGVELPANVIYGAFRLGRVTSNFMFDSIISAAAKKGKAKVLSDPKVATLNNKEANINITTQIPYTTTETTGSTPPVLTTKVVYVTTGIILKVTPTITSDGKVALKVNPSVSQPSPTIVPVAGGAPGIDTRSADTNVIVNNGDTIVIGGLIHDTQSDYTFKVPLLGDIPLLGALFKKKSSVRSRMELLIFVTPKILD